LCGVVAVKISSPSHSKIFSDRWCVGFFFVLCGELLTFLVGATLHKTNTSV